MRYLLGLILAGGVLLVQVSDAKAQFRRGKRHAGFRATCVQQPSNVQPTAVNAQPYPSRAVSDHTTNPSQPAKVPTPASYQNPSYGPQSSYVVPATYGPQPAYGAQPTYGPQPAYGTQPTYGPQQAYGPPTYVPGQNPTFGGHDMTITGPGGVSASLPLQPR